MSKKNIFIRLFAVLLIADVIMEGISFRGGDWKDVQWIWGGLDLIISVAIALGVAIVYRPVRVKISEKRAADILRRKTRTVTETEGLIYGKMIGVNRFFLGDMKYEKKEGMLYGPRKIVKWELTEAEQKKMEKI